MSADVLILTYVRSHIEFGMPVLELNFKFFPWVKNNFNCMGEEAILL